MTLGTILLQNTLLGTHTTANIGTGSQTPSSLCTGHCSPSVEGHRVAITAAPDRGAAASSPHHGGRARQQELAAGGASQGSADSTATSPRPRPMRKACVEENCDKHAYYGVPGGKPVFCALHKDVGYVNVHNKMCSRQGCYKRPHYGDVGGKAIYCVTHKDPAMVNIHGRRCNHLDCNKQPTFGRKGQKAMFCSGHREDDMVDVVYKRCEYPGGCEKHPHFGAEGERARFCGRHKAENMVNVKHRRCQQPGCRRERQFTEDPNGNGNGNGNSKPLYCSLHLAYQERGIDPRSCDLDLPPGLMPLPSMDRRSGSESSGSGGGGGGGGAGVGAPPRLGPAGGLLMGLDLGGGRDPPLYPSLPHRKRGKLGFGGDDVGVARASEVSDQRLHKAKQQQQMQHLQHMQQRRLYEAQNRQQLSGGGNVSGGGSGSGGAEIVTPPSTTYLPPTSPTRASYDSHGFGVLSAAHTDSGFSGGSSFRVGASGMANTSGFVDAPLNTRAPMATVGGRSGDGRKGSVGGISSRASHRGLGSFAVHSSSSSSPLVTVPSLWWPSTGSRGSMSSGGTGGVSTSISAGGGIASSSRACSVMVGVGDGDGGSSGGGGGARVRDGNNLEIKPPPTEPSVHGPLHQYSGRSGMPGGHAILTHGRLPMLPGSGLPGLSRQSPAQLSPALHQPDLLPAISTMRALTTAARPWSGGSGSGGGISQHHRAGGHDGSAGMALSAGGQQQQGSQQALFASLDSGGQDVGQLLGPTWESSSIGSGGSGFLGAHFDGFDGASVIGAGVVHDAGELRASSRWEQQQRQPQAQHRQHQVLSLQQQQQQQQRSHSHHLSLGAFQHEPPGRLPTSSQPPGRSG